MRLAHNVYFLLKDRSDAATAKMVQACRRDLSVQRGIAFFACGTRAKDLQREVNDIDWDVSLHLVFATAKDQAEYQDDPTHKKFISDNSGNWARVRVFDSLVE